MAAMLAALVFAFGAANQSKAAISVYLEAAAWLPWVLVAYDAARKRGGPALALPPLVLTQQLCTGAPQYTYFTLAILTAHHSLSCLTDRSSAGAAWRALGLTLALGLLVATAQILPEWELARHSDRGAKASYDYATQFSLKPEHFGAGMVQPWFFGSFDTQSRDGFFPGEESGYVGLITLPLAAMGAAAGLRRRRTRLRTGIWLGVAAVSLFLAFGVYNPLYPLCYRLIPGLALFRGPARWLLVFGFALAFLAGRGFDLLRARGPAIRIGRAAATTVALLASAAAIFLASAEPTLASGSVHVGLAIAGAGALALSWAEHRRERRLLPGMALGLLAADLLILSFGMEIQHDLPVSAVAETPPSVRELRSLAGTDRLAPAGFSVPLERWQLPDGGVGREDTQIRMEGLEGVRTAMPSCVPSQWGTLGISGAWGALMPLRRHAKPVFQPDTPTAARRKWLRLMDARYYIFLGQPPLEGLEILSQNGSTVARDPMTMPHAFIVGGVRETAVADAMRAVSDSSFDPRREVILEAPAETTPTTQPFQPLAIEEYRPERVRITADASAQGGSLVLMDTFYPGWKAWVDGKPAPLRPANWVGRQVSLAPGAHAVEMRFEPAAVRVGLFLSLAGIGLVSGLAAHTFRGAGRR
jgi:hypothetical protein